MRVERLSADFDAGADAFVDTVAAMACLDLVVACDTSIAHLAGALAVPVWVALKCDAEWRWLTDRADSPWYPTMRLFRQTRRGVWGDVFEAMARELGPLAERRATQRSVSTPCSLGELIDKITILRIKAKRISEADKLANVHRELELLERLLPAAIGLNRHREERSDVAIQESPGSRRSPGLLRRSASGRTGVFRRPMARNDDRGSTQMQFVPTREDGASAPSLNLLTDQLAAVNARLWTIEDAIRACEHEGDFGPRFIALARSVYCENDTRAAIKRAINTLAGSGLVEEKSYA